MNQSPKEITVHDVVQLLASETPPRLVDVREPSEHAFVHLEGGQLFTESLAQEIIRQWPQDTPIVCYCHHGIRSAQAAMFLAGQGFTDVTTMRGGIDAWALEVDSSLARY